MKVPIDDLIVYFPYPYIYPEQYLYMKELKKTLDAGGHCILEMPTGTGKTVTLLSFFVSYRASRPGIGKLIYCTRTVGEIDKVLEELERVLAYRRDCNAVGASESQLVAIGLTTRRNLCLHPMVKDSATREEADSKCRSLTASWVREGAVSTSSDALCQYYENLQQKGEHFQIPPGVYSMSALNEFGEEQGICPYFLARRSLQYASIIVYNYHYLLDPKIARTISTELQKECVVVFDEAHNIDDVCIETMSVHLKKDTIQRCYQNLSHLSGLVQDAKQKNAQQLQEEYQRVLRGIPSLATSETDAFTAAPILPNVAIEETIPGNIRKAEHFLRFLRRILEFMQNVMQRSAVCQETTWTFLQSMANVLQTDLKALKFASDRLQSLIQTLQITHMLELQPIRTLADFVTILGCYPKSNSFVVIFEPYDERYPSIPDPLLQLACLDASLAMQPVFSRFRSVVLTSGTISPIELYSRILMFTPVVAKSLTMSFQRRNVCPMIVTRGTDQLPISSKYDYRHDPSVVRNYGALVMEMARIVPDGVVCFFTSYIYMEHMIQMWHEMGIVKKLSEYKLIFIETPDNVECTLALKNFRKACDCGRGAVFMCVARGKVAEGIDFDRHYGRCVIVLGVPFQYTESRVLRARLEFLRTNLQISEGDFLSFDAVRQAAQCIGRVIRSKTDYGIMVFADKRFNRADKKNKLPRWVIQFLDDAHCDLSVDMAVSIASAFLKQIAQPFYADAATEVALLSEEQLARLVETSTHKSESFEYSSYPLTKVSQG